MPISVPVGHLPARGEADRLADRGQEGLRRDGTLLSFGAAEGEIIQVGRTLATIEIEDSDEEPERSLVGELESAASAELPPSREARLSFLPFFLKFAALALREYPLLNAAYHPERQEVEQFAEVNLGVAVDTAEGLQVPVIQRADILSLPRIQAEVDRLAAGGAAGRHLHHHQLWGLRRAVRAAPDPAAAGGHPGPGAHPRAAGGPRRDLGGCAPPAPLPGVRPPGVGRCVRRTVPPPLHGPGRAAAGVALVLKREEVKGPGLHAHEPPANQTGIDPALFQPAAR